MKAKLLLAALVLSLPLTMANGCKPKPRICEPHDVRRDSYMHNRWWVCNNDGTEEKPVYGPKPDDSVKV